MRKLIQSVGPYLWRRRRGLALGMGALMIKDLFGAALPLVIKSGIDSLTGGFRLRKVFEFAAILVALSLGKGVFQYWMRVILIRISRDIEYDLRNELFAHLVRLSSTFYARYRTGDIMARATNDLNAVRMMLGPGIMYWTETTITAVLAIAVMLSVDWRLTLLALIPAPVVTLVVIWFGSRIHDRFEAIQGMFSEISSRVQENLTGVRVIRAYAQEKAELESYELLNQDYIAQNIRLARLSGVFTPLLQALIGLTFLIVLWVGGYRLLSHHITLGSFVMFNTYMGLLIWPMIALGWVVNLMQRGMASWGRIQELIHERPDITGPRNGPLPIALPRARGALIEFRNAGTRRFTKRESHHTSRIDHCDRRSHRQRQEHARAADSAHSGSNLRRGAAGRNRPARSRSGGTATADRLRSAGDVSVQRDTGGKHRLGGARREPRGHRACGGSGRPWPRHRRLPQWIRHRYRRTRLDTVRRSEAAHGDRARDPTQSARVDPG